MRREELATLLSGGPVLLDGAMGTMLMAAGLPSGCAPERWNLTEPGRVEAVHRAYAAAGSRIVHTNTFGASPPRLAAGGLAGRCGEVNRRAVELALRAVAGGALVAGDVGPTGLFLPPLGAATEAEFEDAFAAQVEAQAEGGVDLLSIETMTDLREALAAVRAARATGLPLLACMTFEPRRRGAFTMMGNPLLASLQALQAAGADAVGCNCSVTPEEMAAMVREACAVLTVPVVAQPNAGHPHPTEAPPAYDMTPSAFADGVVRLVKAGAVLVGGCCGTTPEFILALATGLVGVAPA